MAFPTPFVSVGPVGIWGQTPAGTYAPIGITTPTAATGVLTLSSNAVAGETVTIGQQKYTWAASANVQTPNIVKIGADASTSIDNLIAAINATAASQGSLYSFNTIPNTQVTAAVGAGDTMGATAITAGANGNLIATTETMSGGAWASATLTGGTPSALDVTYVGMVGTTVVTGITEVDTLGAPITTTTTNIAAGAFDITIVPLSGFIGTINGTAWLDAATADALGGTYERVAQPGNVLGAYTVTRSAGKYAVLVSRPA